MTDDREDNIHRVRRELDDKIERGDKDRSTMSRKIAAIHAMLVEDGFKKSMIDLQDALDHLEPRMVAMEVRAKADEALDIHTMQMKKYRRQNLTLWVAIASIILGNLTALIIFLSSRPPL